MKWLCLCGTAATLAVLLACWGCSGSKQPIDDRPSHIANSPSLPTRGEQPPASPDFSANTKERRAPSAPYARDGAGNNALLC